MMNHSLPNSTRFVQLNNFENCVISEKICEKFSEYHRSDIDPTFLRRAIGPKGMFSSVHNIFQNQI